MKQVGLNYKENKKVSEFEKLKFGYARWNQTRKSLSGRMDLFPS